MHTAGGHVSITRQGANSDTKGDNANKATQNGQQDWLPMVHMCLVIVLTRVFIFCLGLPFPTGLLGSASVLSWGFLYGWHVSRGLQTATFQG